MKKRFMALLTILVLLAVIFTVTRREEAKQLKSKSDTPTLVVGIVIDQMRYDYLYRYWDSYSDGGFKRIINNGFSCENHHFSYIPTYTGPGHASVYSGTTPNVHGIIANDWHVKGTDSSMYCVEDQSVNPVGTDNVMERRSPRNIKVTNMSDEIKLAFSYKSKVIGVSVKDRGAVLPAGKLADAAYWFTGYEGGKFVTSDYYMDELPVWVDSLNNSDYIQNYIDQGWDLLKEKSAYWQSNEDDSPYEGKEPRTFPYDLKAIQKEEGDVNLIKATPYGNEIITEFGLLALEKEKLGLDEYIDVLALSYSTPDYVGHRFGTRAMETQDTYLRLDLSLARLMNELDKKVGEGNYILFVTADHGAAINGQELIDKKVNIDYLDSKAFAAFVTDVAKEEFGNADLIENVSNMQIFLSGAVLKEMDLERDDVEEILAERIIDYPGIATATTATSLQIGSYDGHKELLYKGYNQKMSGNVLYSLEPGWMSYSRTGTTHGSGYAYDTHVPFLLYGHGIPHGHTHRRTLVEDIAPTITSLIHVQHPMAATGNPVFEVLD